MTEGWIKLHRQILESQVFANQTALKIWVWCLLKASRKERFVPLKIGKGSITVKILPGQFIFGRFKAEEELNIDGSTVYRWIQKFKSDEFGMINIEVSNQYSIVTICNWANYQTHSTEGEQPMSNQRTTNEQPTNTDKTVKKVKTVEKSNSVIFEDFRNKYPGTKRGLKTELDSFLKNNSSEIIPFLLPALEKEIAHRNKLLLANQFIPNWKNLSTWINKKCWEQEFTEEKQKIGTSQPNPETHTISEFDFDSLTAQRLGAIHTKTQAQA